MGFEEVPTQSICHYLIQSLQQRPHKTAIKFRKNRTWVSQNWKDVFFQIENISASLQTLGIEQSDHVAIMSDTRPEWFLCDLGIMGLGAVTIPIYQTLTPEEVEVILQDSQPKMLILENAAQLKKWEKIADHCPSVEKIVCIEPFSGLDDKYLSWEEFLDEGQELLTINPNFLTEKTEDLKENTLATIVYTSGTSGKPKGVMITHEQILSEVDEVFSEFSLSENDTTLSFLPMAHILGRVESWGALKMGYRLAFAESIERIPANLRQVKPTLLIAVPRIFEKIYSAILTEVEANPAKQKLFDWGLDIGKKVSQLRSQKKSLPLDLAVQYRAARTFIFNRIKEKLGGNLRFAISGGAPLEKEIGEFFHAANILILEGYGLTETTAAICANTPYAYRFGTVGKPLGDVEIKLAADGEIFVRSKKVSVGYYNNEEANREAFENGFFKTGDIGEFTNDGFLKITDRKKDLIKTAGGKYVAPQKLESLLRMNPLISNVLIHGDKKKYIVALITLDPQKIEAFAKEKGIPFQNIPQLTQHGEVRILVKRMVSEVNAQLASYESIKNFGILQNDFTIEGGELTPSLKVKRKFCDEKYTNQIEELYI